MTEEIVETESKKCYHCLETKPATNEYFNYDKRNNKLHGSCKECRNQFTYTLRVKYRIADPILAFARKTLWAHRATGHGILMSVEELVNLINRTTSCPICGVEFTDWKDMWRRHKNDPTYWNMRSLDRINNENIIKSGNVQIICVKCNTIKGNMTMDEFLNYCKAVYDKYFPDDFAL